MGSPCAGRLEMCAYLLGPDVPLFCHMHDHSCRSSWRVCHCTACTVASVPLQFLVGRHVDTRFRLAYLCVFVTCETIAVAVVGRSATAQPAVVGKYAAAVWVCRHVDIQVAAGSTFQTSVLCHLSDHSCCSSWHRATAQPAVVGSSATAVWVCRHVDTEVGAAVHSSAVPSCYSGSRECFADCTCCMHCRHSAAVLSSKVQCCSHWNFLGSSMHALVHHRSARLMCSSCPVGHCMEVLYHSAK